MILGVVIAVSTTAGVAGLAAVTDQAADRSSTTMVETELNASAVTVTHAGGDAIPAADVSIRIDHGGTVDRYRLNGTDGPGDVTPVDAETWQPGDEWRLASPPYDPDDAVVVEVIHDPSGETLDRTTRDPTGDEPDEPDDAGNGDAGDGDDDQASDDDDADDDNDNGDDGKDDGDDDDADDADDDDADDADDDDADDADDDDADDADDANDEDDEADDADDDEDDEDEDEDD